MVGGKDSVPGRRFTSGDKSGPGRVTLVLGSWCRIPVSGNGGSPRVTDWEGPRCWIKVPRSGGANTVRGTCSGCGGLDLGNARLVYERGRLGGILGRKAVETGEFGARKDAQQALQASCRDGLGESFPCSYYMSQNSTRIKSYGRLKVSAAHIRSCCSTFSSHGDSRVVPLGRLTW